MNISYLSNLLDSFKIDKRFQFIEFQFLYTNDKHYPGLKKIILISKRNCFERLLNGIETYIYQNELRKDNLLYNEIFYADICKIFNQRLTYGMFVYFKNQIGDGTIRHNDIKYVKIGIENDKETIIAMFQKLEQTFEEYSYTINSIKDMYV